MWPVSVAIQWSSGAFEEFDTMCQCVCLCRYSV